MSLTPFTPLISPLIMPNSSSPFRSTGLRAKPATALALLVFVVLVIFFASLVSAPAFAQPLNESQKILASDGAASDSFGYAVAIDGDTAVIGAYHDDDDGSNSGSAYVFVNVGGIWFQQQKLTASDAVAGDNFGESVAVSGDSVFVGASNDDDDGINSGSVYVFTRSVGIWSEQQKLAASDAAATDRFGHSVALEGDTAVVGSFQDDAGATNTGSAYVFTRSGSTWSEEQKLTASDAAAGDLLGYHVSLSVDSALVGAYGNDDAGSNSGSAYVFTRSGSTWSQEQKLTAADAAISDNFGWSTAIEGDVAMIGSRNDDDDGSNSGSVYVFTRSGSTWTPQPKLTASDAASGDLFGIAVALRDGELLVGAQGNSDSGTGSGSAYLFTEQAGVWGQDAKLLASDGAAVDWFGSSVAIDSGVALVSAHPDDDNGGASGSAYLFDDDLDGDGLSNDLELTLGTSPTNPDSDGDGLSDFDEVNMDADPTNYTPGIDTDPLDPDTDGDGNLDGSDPDPLDPLAFYPVPLLSPLGMGVLTAWLAGLGVLGARGRASR